MTHIYDALLAGVGVSLLVSLVASLLAFNTVGILVILVGVVLIAFGLFVRPPIDGSRN